MKTFDEWLESNPHQIMEEEYGAAKIAYNAGQRITEKFYEEILKRYKKQLDQAWIRIDLLERK
jgi:hypothetical protein